MAFRSLRWISLAAAAAGLAGCVRDAAPGIGPLSAAAPVPGPASSAAPAMGAFLETGAGSKLADSDREAAFQAETQALASGERKAWRGTRGVYGYVVPSAAAGAADVVATGACRTFTHTIYFSGRPQTGRGTGCRDGDGTWRVTS